MKQITLVLLFLATANAQAEWTLVGESEIKEGRLAVYVDLETISKAGDFAKMWGLYDFSIPKLLRGEGEYRSIKFQGEFDCGQKRLRVLSLAWYAANKSTGEPIASTGVDIQWTPVSSGSVDEAVWEAACSAPHAASSQQGESTSIHHHRPGVHQRLAFAQRARWQPDSA
jgi:hypothetical protein